MTCITVTTQSELDAALHDDAADCVHITSPAGVWLSLSGNRRKVVEAHGSASVHAWGSASVRAWDSASVHAWDSASVHAWDSARVSAHHEATVAAGPHVAVHLHSGQATVTGGVLIDLTALDLTDAATWCDHHGVTVVDGRAVLYKALGADLTTGLDYDDEHPYVWTPGAELVCHDWRDDNECGGGLHLSPTPEQATAYRHGASRWMRCTVAVADVRPITDGGAAKAKCSQVRVEAEVDAMGREIARSDAREAVSADA